MPSCGCPADDAATSRPTETPWWRLYRPEAYAALPEFEPDPKAVTTLQPAIDRLGATIRHFGCEEVLGICLLHRHFDLGPDERLVRFVEGPDRGHARPVPAHRAAGCLPWIWAPLPGPAGRLWAPVEWVDTRFAPPGSATLLSHLGPIFDAVAAHIPPGEARLGLAALYGFCGFDIDAGAEVAETTDEALRRLELRVAPVAARAPGPSVQTLWRFGTSTHAPA